MPIVDYFGDDEILEQVHALMLADFACDPADLGGGVAVERGHVQGAGWPWPALRR